jgi:hypothetical protein
MGQEIDLFAGAGVVVRGTGGSINQSKPAAKEMKCSKEITPMPKC